MPKPTIRDMDRFLSRLKLTPDCWEWGGHRIPGGYGRFWYAGRMWLAHRFSILLVRGDVGPELDHVCRNRACVRPSHLREVSRLENVMAPGSLTVTKVNAEKTHCVHGHEFTPENVYMLGRRRRCRECNRQWLKRRNRSEAHKARERVYRRARRALCQ